MAYGHYRFYWLDMKGIRLQTEQMTIPSGTTAGTPIELKVTLDPNFKRCSGYTLFEKANAGNHKFEIALSDKDGKIQDTVIADYLFTDASVKPSERLTAASFPAANNQINIVARPLVNTTAAIELYLLFQLEN